MYIIWFKFHKIFIEEVWKLRSPWQRMTLKQYRTACLLKSHGNKNFLIFKFKSHSNKSMESREVKKKMRTKQAAVLFICSLSHQTTVCSLKKLVSQCFCLDSEHTPCYPHPLFLTQISPFLQSTPICAISSKIPHFKSDLPPSHYQANF